ncbi:hypothetical protein [Actimicrobium sp. GrIS 1.19]|uniref:hypothetical protein n=1 Tax=Actimicrobium sp. GrIS 1.19 TaxID=3071708 RepID=UPI002E162A7E
MPIPPIRTAAEHAVALREIDALILAETGTPEGDRLDQLARDVAAYAAESFATQ